MKHYAVYLDRPKTKRILKAKGVDEAYKMAKEYAAQKQAKISMFWLIWEASK